MHGTVAAVWLYEGLWCKLLNGDPNQARIVEAASPGGLPIGAGFLKSLGFLAVAIAVWILTGIAPLACAFAQTILLVGLNTGGILWARRLIHDPIGMLLKNAAFLVLVWVSASFPGWI
jgi:hypothetical protein